MKSPLSTLCLILWIAGLLAMFTLKGALDSGPGTNAFSTAQGIWVTGGLGYALIGTLGIILGDGSTIEDKEQ
ncbi:MAG: hypothetical protein ACI8QS_002762 [Planctomycetota bacterium]|jgi:hypothetical protein